MKTAIATDDLYYCAINVEPINFDFGFDWGATWEPVEIPFVYCQSRCDFVGNADSYDEGDECPECGGYLELPSVEPLMNYYYPLPDYDRDPVEDQMLLHSSEANVVIVRINDDDDEAIGYALALTGGGMDLSFDICLAYVLMGYAPPIHFCDLPLMAGQDNRREPFASVIKACFQSLKAAQNRLHWIEGSLLKAQSWTGKAE